MILVVRNYQKSTIWFNFIIAMLVMRGANKLSVLLAFISVGLRVLQSVSVVIQNQNIAICAYIFSTVIIILMWFDEFSNENADIIHEAHPTTETINEMKEIMFPNYKP